MICQIPLEMRQFTMIITTSSKRVRLLGAKIFSRVGFEALRVAFHFVAFRFVSYYVTDPFWETLLLDITQILLDITPGNASIHYDYKRLV